MSPSAYLPRVTSRAPKARYSFAPPPPCVNTSQITQAKSRWWTLTFPFLSNLIYSDLIFTESDDIIYTTNTVDYLFSLFNMISQHRHSRRHTRQNAFSDAWRTELARSAPSAMFGYITPPLYFAK